MLQIRDHQLDPPEHEEYDEDGELDYMDLLYDRNRDEID